jgi:hypothetical protein
MNLYQVQPLLPFTEMAHLLGLPLNCLTRKLVMIVCNPNGDAKGYYSTSESPTNAPQE